MPEENAQMYTHLASCSCGQLTARVLGEPVRIHCHKHVSLSFSYPDNRSARKLASRNRVMKLVEQVFE